MVEPVDPTTRKSNTYPVLPVELTKLAAQTADAQRTDGAVRDPEKPAPTPALPEPPHYDVEIVRRGDAVGGLGINVVRMLNPSTGQPIYQSPPEGVLVMLENALWRLRTKDSR